MEAALTAATALAVTNQGDGEVTILSLAGELDLSTTPLLDESLNRLDRRGPVVLDLGELTFIDSHGLRALFGYAARQELIVARPHPHVARVLSLTKSDRVMRIEDTLEAALPRPQGG